MKTSPIQILIIIALFFTSPSSAEVTVAQDGTSLPQRESAAYEARLMVFNLAKALDFPVSSNFGGLEYEIPFDLPQDYYFVNREKQNPKSGFGGRIFSLYQNLSMRSDLDLMKLDNQLRDLYRYGGVNSFRIVLVDYAIFRGLIIHILNSRGKHWNRTEELNRDVAEIRASPYFPTLMNEADQVDQKMEDILHKKLVTKKDVVDLGAIEIFAYVVVTK